MTLSTDWRKWFERKCKEGGTGLHKKPPKLPSVALVDFMAVPKGQGPCTVDELAGLLCGRMLARAPSSDVYIIMCDDKGNMPPPRINVRSKRDQDENPLALYETALACIENGYPISKECLNMSDVTEHVLDALLKSHVLAKLKKPILIMSAKKKEWYNNVSYDGIDEELIETAFKYGEADLRIAFLAARLAEQGETVLADTVDGDFLVSMLLWQKIREEMNQESIHGTVYQYKSVGALSKENPYQDMMEMYTFLNADWDVVSVVAAAFLLPSDYTDTKLRHPLISRTVNIRTGSQLVAVLNRAPEDFPDCGISINSDGVKINIRLALEFQKTMPLRTGGLALTHEETMLQFQKSILNMAFTMAYFCCCFFEKEWPDHRYLGYDEIGMARVQDELVVVEASHAATMNAKITSVNVHESVTHHVPFQLLGSSGVPMYSRF